MTGFNPGSGQQDDLMKRLMAMLGDTGFGGLQALLARLFGQRRGGVAPIGEGSSFGGKSSGNGGGGGGGASSGGGGPSGPVLGDPSDPGI